MRCDQIKHLLGEMKKLLTGHLNISPALSERQREEIAFKKKDAKADYDDCFHLSWVMRMALMVDGMQGIHSAAGEVWSPPEPFLVSPTACGGWG